MNSSGCAAVTCAKYSPSVRVDDAGEAITRSSDRSNRSALRGKEKLRRKKGKIKESRYSEPSGEDHERILSSLLLEVQICYTESVSSSSSSSASSSLDESSAALGSVSPLVATLISPSLSPRSTSPAPLVPPSVAAWVSLRSALASPLRSILAAGRVAVRCLPADDPELRRPNLEPAPNLRIDSRPR